MMNTRNARGTYAQKAIKLEQRRFKAITRGSGDAAADSEPVESATEQAERRSADIFYFHLRDTSVPLPLGWMLSKAAAETMQNQLQEAEKDDQNGATVKKIADTLPPAAPAAP
jgi:hypothetical protein